MQLPFMMSDWQPVTAGAGAYQGQAGVSRVLFWRVVDRIPDQVHTVQQGGNGSQDLHTQHIQPIPACMLHSLLLQAHDVYHCSLVAPECLIICCLWCTRAVCQYCASQQVPGSNRFRPSLLSVAHRQHMGMFTAPASIKASRGPNCYVIKSVQRDDDRVQLHCNR